MRSATWFREDHSVATTPFILLVPDVPLELTPGHVRVLDAIGYSGGTRTRLVAELADGPELHELEQAGYVWRDSIAVPDPTTGSARMDIWYLTDLGANAVGIDPARLYRP